LKTQPVAAIAGSVFLLSFALSIIVISLDFIGAWPLERWETLHFPGVASVIGLLGIGIVVVAQGQMRNSWRIGVDPKEKTALITDGLFGRSRNPIYFGIFVYWIGLAGTLPHPVMWCLAVVCWVSIESIVQCVEEPSLMASHGSAYQRYFERTNRYLIL